ncbi:MAG: glycosyltransferase family 2 protein [Phycisphaerales bacterium]|nr:glycosyltransferase family 2 protein [Phycisphaerales bacterium]
MTALCFVVPAFNARATIGTTLRSLLAQTRGDWSAIVVDDGSGDGTGDAALALGDRRIGVVRQANAGLGAARNAGWDAARADAVCFLDADDTVAPAFAARMLAALDGHDLAACAYAMVGPDLEDVGWVIHPGEHDLTAARLLRHNPLAVGGVVVRRSGAGRAAGPLFDPALPVHEDWECWLRLTAAGARWAPVVQEPLFHYRMRPGSMSDALRTMWLVGLRVIDRASAAPGLRARAAREWTLRSIGRAAACGDAALVRECAGSAGGLDNLSAEEAAVLRGAAAWGLCRQEGVGPGGGADRRRAWRGRITGACAEYPALRGALRELDFAGPSWREVAGAAAELAGTGGLVVYGMGRNGRALAQELAALGIAFAWCDDDAKAAAPIIPGLRAVRVARASMTGDQLVIVTPDHAAPILAALTGLRALTPPRVVAAARATVAA